MNVKFGLSVKVKMFENRLPKRIFRSTRDEVTGG
jgi:hypothetical protein